MTNSFALADQNSPTSTFELLKGIWGHLSRRRRIQLGSLLIVMLASGGAEVVSLGAVLPFLAVLSDPEKIWRQSLMQALAAQIGWTKSSELLLPATLAFAAAAVLAAMIRLLNLWLNSRLAAAIGFDLSCEAYRRTLCQPYSVHVQRNSAAVITTTTTEISKTVSALNSLLQLLTSAVVAVGLMTGLMVIDASVALAAAALFAASYGGLALTARRELRSNGSTIAEASRQQLKALQEALGAIRDVLLDGSQSTYLEIYRQTDRPQRQLQARNNFLATFPRFALEAIGMVSIALIGLLLVMQRGDGVSVIPLLGTMALGAQRLLPALQQIYGSWSTLTALTAPMQGVLAMLNQPLQPDVSGVEPLPLTQSIRLQNVDFRYSQDQQYVLQGLDLEILRGERIGLIGSTGGGKSTTVDLLMGLLVPTAGRVLVDGADLHDPAYPERLVAWRSSIAHVPQSVYLADSSFAENIAFGVPTDQINLGQVRKAASQAQISTFIESNAEGYDSYVGERGIRLSGGQRQRIGIARALYKQASVLVFDEATSALDSRTETAVIDAINGLSDSLTVIMIAHRLSTLENCDRVIRLAQGYVTADGPPRLVLPSKV